MLKKTKKSSSGTSFHGAVIKTTPSKLVKLFGNPTFLNNDGTDKVNIEWELEDLDGNVITIYDWKEGRPVSMDEVIEFHIGALSGYDTLNAKSNIHDTLKNIALVY